MVPELLPCQRTLKDTVCVCVCCPGTERSVCPRAFGAKGDEVPAAFEGTGVWWPEEKLVRNLSKVGNGNGEREETGVFSFLVFILIFFLSFSFPVWCCSGTALGSPLHLGKPRAHFLCWYLDELFHGMGAELGCF